MTCRWHTIDCKFENVDKTCDLCFTNRLKYKKKPIKKAPTINKKRAKQDNRMGSRFEYTNHKNNINLLKDDVVTKMTLNSGATVLEKGDEQILGLVNIMEELKTKVAIKAPGKKQFTINKEWLTKLKREAQKENMDFSYLKFSFNEDDKDIYVVIEQEEIMSMVKTMVEDRRSLRRIENEIEQIKLEKELLETEIASLKIDKELLRLKVEHKEGYLITIPEKRS